MPAEIQPVELARVVDFAERSRVGDWSLRSALVRYAEGQPVRVSHAAGAGAAHSRRRFHALGKVLEKRGAELWARSTVATSRTPTTRRIVDLLRAAIELDRLGDALAAWADDRTGSRPDDTVDAVDHRRGRAARRARACRARSSHRTVGRGA